MYKVQLQPLAMPGATRSSAPTISTPSMHPRPSCHQTGSLERTRCRENLISLLNYRHQLKGEDMKYGMLLGVNAVLFYQLKAEANGIVWKRTKWCKTFFIRNLTCHTHTQRQSWHHQCISRQQQQRRDAFSDHDQTHPIGWSRVQWETFFIQKRLATLYLHHYML